LSIVSRGVYAGPATLSSLLLVDHHSASMSFVVRSLLLMDYHSAGSAQNSSLALSKRHSVDLSMSLSLPSAARAGHGVLELGNQAANASTRW